MTFVDLFSGVGGFRLGMEMAGHVCLGHCEIDKFANKSYIAMHSPREDEWFATDITRVRADEIPIADCWCFGFPCQDISIAGKGKGFRGNRSSLFFAVTGLIKDTPEENRPSYLLIENVKNLLSVNRGFDFAKLLIELDEIGYDAEWDVLNSAEVVPQNRERVFIVGHFRGRGTREVFPIGRSDGEAGDQANVKQIGNVCPTQNRDNPNQGRVYDPGGIAPCLNKMEGGNRQPMVLVTKRNNEIRERDVATCLDANYGKGLDCHQQRTGVAIYQKPRGKNNGGLHDTAPTLSSGSYQQNNMVVSGVYTGASKEFQRPPLPNTSRSIKANKHDAGIYDGMRIRKLTPLECFRLQGFPDEYFYRAQAVNSDSQLYRQAGNGVTVTVIYEIAQRMGTTPNTQTK